MLFRWKEVKSVFHFMEQNFRNDMIFLRYVFPNDKIFRLLIRYVVIQKLSNLWICYCQRPNP